MFFGKGAARKITVTPNIYISFLVATVIVSAAWIKVLITPGFVMHGDITFPTNIQNYVLNFTPLWNQHPSYSNLDEIDRLAVMVPILWLVKLAHLDIGTYSRLFLFFISLCGSYTIIIGKHQIEDLYFPEARDSGWTRVSTDVMACVLFCFNPWALYRISAPFFSISYAMSPLVIAYQLRFLASGSWSALLIATIAWTLASGSPQYTIFFGVLSLLLFLWLGKKSIKDWTIATARFFVILALYGVFNLYWIAPAWHLIHLQTISPGYTLNWADVELFSSKATFLNVIAGTDFWVTWWEKNNPFATGAIGFFASICRTLIFAAAMAFAVIYRRRPFAVFSALVILVLIILLQGAHGPFRALYHDIVFGVLPSGYGWIVRAPEKFGAFLWLFYSLLISIGATLWLSPRGRASRIGAICVAATILILGWGPLVYGTLLTNYVPVRIPEDYNALASRFSHAPGKVLVLADYEDNSRWVSGDAIFRWAPTKMAGFVIARSIPAPTFGGYHFQNPFSFFYSFIREAGPRRIPTFAAILGTRYILLEHDVEGDSVWYARWRVGLLRAGASLVNERRDFALFELNDVPSAESRTGPYAVLAGDASQLNVLIDRFGPSLGSRNVVFLNQQLTKNFGILTHAHLLLLHKQTLADAVAATYPREFYTPLFSRVFNNDLTVGWGHARLNNPDEENEAGWNIWQARRLLLPTTWPLDLGLGIVSTSKIDARLSITVPIPFRYSEVFIRVFDFTGHMKPRLSIKCGNVTKVFIGSSTTPAWHWFRVGEFVGPASMNCSLVDLRGAPAVGAFLATPAGDIARREHQLRVTLGKRIMPLDTLRTLRAWPAAIGRGSIDHPSTSVSASGSLLLDEDYDPFWRYSADDSLTPIPGWLFATMFAPVKGGGELYFIPQRDLDRWWRIQLELLALAAMIVAARFLIVAYRRQGQRASQRRS